MADRGAFTAAVEEELDSPIRVFTIAGIETVVIDHTDFYPASVIVIPSSHNPVIS